VTSSMSSVSSVSNNSSPDRRSLSSLEVRYRSLASAAPRNPQSVAGLGGGATALFGSRNSYPVFFCNWSNPSNASSRPRSTEITKMAKIITFTTASYIVLL